MSNKWVAHQVKRWMQENAREYLDIGTEEVDCTGLAEGACAEFEAYGPGPEYAAPEEFFDWAVEIAEKAYG